MNNNTKSMQPARAVLVLAILSLGVGLFFNPLNKAAGETQNGDSQALPDASQTPANQTSGGKAGYFMPGGFAPCPCEASGSAGDGPLFIISDNTNGRLLQVSAEALQDTGREAILLSGLDNPGDVDIAEGGRAFVYVDGGKVVEHYFGLTCLVHDGAGNPLAGAEVVIDALYNTATTKTDGEGYFTVFDLLPIKTTDPPIALVTVTKGSESRQFPIPLNECCQTIKEIVFAPEEAKKGTLKINVHPPELESAGAQWRLKGIDIWLDITQPLQIFPGMYTVIFSDVDGYKTPEPVVVEVGEDIVIAVEANYQSL
jgi:hypothetical protein